MKHLTIALVATFLTGCAAPPPVKIASKLLDRSVVKEARTELTGSGDTRTQTIDQQQ